MDCSPLGPLSYISFLLTSLLFSVIREKVQKIILKRRKRGRERNSGQPKANRCLQALFQDAQE